MSASAAPVPSLLVDSRRTKPSEPIPARATSAYEVRPIVKFVLPSWGKCLLLSNMVPFVIEYDRIHVYCVCILHVFLPVSGNSLAYPSDTPDTRIRCVSDVYPMYPPVSTVATKIREDMPPDTHRRFPLGWAKTRLCIHFCILR